GIATVTIGGDTYALSALSGKTITTDKGTLTIGAVTPNGTNTSATIEYSYTLDEAQTHAAQGADSVTDPIEVVVNGVGGSEATGTITITSVDDLPVAGDFTAGSVTEDDAAANSVGGNLRTDGGNTFGADDAAAANALTYTNV